MRPLIPSAAVVVNATVTGTRALAATRSPAAMVNTTPVGLLRVEHMNLIDADPGAVLFFVHTLLG